MNILVNQLNKTYVYANVIKVTHNHEKKTLLLEFKGLFKKRWTLLHGITSNDWFVK